VQFEIEPDGRVTGRIGDSAISSARLVRNRSWFGRWIGWRTEYIIMGELADRRSFTVPFNPRSDVLSGSVFVKRGGGHPAPAHVSLRRSN
jgi:hypothetical protein